MIPFNNFKKRYSLHKRDIDKAVKRVFSRGWFILGPEVEEFEKKFSIFTGAKYCVGVDSGTDAIYLALRALSVGAGDEVITVANTATPTVSAIRMTGAVPVFADICKDTLVIDPKDIEKRVTAKTRAIVPVHLYGHPADMASIMKIAKKHSLAVVEDSCQAHGARYNGKMVGTIGDAGAFSFYPTKNLGAMGDAGAIITGSLALSEALVKLRNYGEEQKFKNKIEGVNARLDEIQASILNWGIKRLNQWNKKRRSLAMLYTKLLSDSGVGLPPAGDSVNQRVWHLFVIRAKEREALRAFLKDKGVETAIHYPTPIHLQEAYSFLRQGEETLPETIAASEEILSLPLYPELEEKEVRKICGLIKKFYSSSNT